MKVVFLFLYSDRKFMTAMRHADLNANGRINLHEIGAFLFPEREEAFQVMVCIFCV